MTYPELKIHLDLLSKEEKRKFLQSYEPKFMTSNNKFFIVCDDGTCHLFDNSGNECNISKMHDIRYNAFSNCKSLISITIPDSINSIENEAFFNCTSLKSISIPDSVESIGNYAFTYCESLTNITIPNSVKNIGHDAFFGCISLTSISIGNSVKSIGDWAFYHCSSLKEVVFKGKTIDEVKAMDNYLWGIEDKSIIKCKI